MWHSVPGYYKLKPVCIFQKVKTCQKKYILTRNNQTIKNMVKSLWTTVTITATGFSATLLRK